MTQLSLFTPDPRPATSGWIVIDMRAALDCRLCDAPMRNGWCALPYYEEPGWHALGKGTFVCVCRRCFAVYDRRRAS